MRTAVCLAMLAALSAVAADPKAKPIPGLKDAQDRYNAALAKAKKEHDAAVKDATEFFAASLKDIQAERTKAGDLDGAVRVREMAAEVGAEGVDLIVGKGKIVPGTWIVTYVPVNATYTYTIKANGDVTASDIKKPGHMKPYKGGFIMDFGDAAIRFCTFAGNRMFVEQFTTKDQAAKGVPDLMAFGELKK